MMPRAEHDYTPRWRVVGWILVAWMLLLACLLTGCAGKPAPLIAPSTASVRASVAESRVSIAGVREQISGSRARVGSVGAALQRASAEIVAADKTVDTLQAGAPQFHREFADLKFRFRAALRELEETQRELVVVKDDLSSAYQRLNQAEDQLRNADTRAAQLQQSIDAQTESFARERHAKDQALLAAAAAKARAAKATTAAIGLGLAGLVGIYAAIRFF